MKKTIFFFLLFILITGIKTNAQRLNGKIVEQIENKQESPIPGASVYWLGTNISTLTDTSGNFSIRFPEILPGKLVIAITGYHTDTTSIMEVDTSRSLKIILRGSVLLKEINVEGKQSATTISTFSPINGELITSKELLKAACCNLSESFSTNATVDVAFTDAVSGAKKIQMLGLDGIYSQILSEQIPNIRGLSSSYGINYIPGPRIESILVTKGTGSVVNGYESITGQINIEFKKPQEVKEWLFVNGYGNNKGRMEANVHIGRKLNDKWASILFLHASDVSMKNDKNKDGFLDMPLTRQYNIFNRWNYHSGKRIEGQLGLSAIMESRQGGQTKFNYNTDYRTTNAYGVGINTRQLEYFSKTGILFPKKPAQSIGIMTSGKWITLDSYFGLKTYKGEQKNFYANGIFQSFINNTNHTYKAGLSFVYDEYDENFSDSSFFRTEIVPGAFAEYTLKQGDIFTAVAGIRGDIHNLYGPILNPRLHLKYNIRPLTAIRLSGGRGFRTPNVFAENTSLFASSRKVMVMQKLKPEIAWNTGASITHKFNMKKNESSLNIDYFYTDFESQVVVERENSRTLLFYNLQGKSYSHSIQFDFGIELTENFDAKLAYKWYDVKTTYSGNLMDKPFVSKNRALLNLAYSTNHDIWKFDFTTNWFSSTRISGTDQNTPPYQLPDKSMKYFILNVQITKAFKYFELYIGSENITDFTQKNPILAADDPFGSNFDASMIWGPMDGRFIYGGFRFKLE